MVATVFPLAGEKISKEPWHPKHQLSRPDAPMVYLPASVAEERAGIVFKLSSFGAISMRK